MDLPAALEHATSVTVVSPVPDETAQGNIRGRCPGCNRADSQKAKDDKELDDKKVLIHEALGSCRTNRLRKFMYVCCSFPPLLPGLANVGGSTRPSVGC